MVAKAAVMNGKSGGSVHTEQESQDKRRALRKALRAAYHGQGSLPTASDAIATVNSIDVQIENEAIEVEATETNKTNENSSILPIKTSTAVSSSATFQFKDPTSLLRSC